MTTIIINNNDDERKEQNGYFWNIVAGLLNAMESVILSAVVTRTLGLESAGVLSLAFAVGNLMMTIGKFGVRNFQVTDVKKRFSFSDYFWARFATTGLMALASAGYVLFCMNGTGDRIGKIVVILSFCWIYMVESVEDVFWGLYQSRMALDVGARLFILRWSLILGAFLIVLKVERSLEIAVLAGAAVGLLAFLIMGIPVFLSFHVKLERPHLMLIKQLLCQCFPLAAVSFLSFYVTNAPKYAIDRYLAQEMQAMYGFLAMPVFAVELLNGFFYQPSLVQMAVEWKEKNIREFCARATLQCLIIAGLTAICMAGAYLCGIPVLSVLFATELEPYWAELLVLVLGGGMLAFSEYFCVLLTIMRKQTVILRGYCGAAVLALLFSGVFVIKYGMMGAAVFYTGLMAVIVFWFWIVYRTETKKENSRKI